MKVKCAECGRRYRIRDSLVAPEGIQIRCPNCNRLFPVYPDSAEQESANTTETTSKVASEATPYTEVDDQEQEEELQQTHVHYEESLAVESTRIQDEPELVSTKSSSSFVEKTETGILVDVDEVSDDEISLPGEVSQVEFDSEASFEDTSEPQQKSGENPLAKTIVNPKPPVGDTAKTPPAPYADSLLRAGRPREVTPAATRAPQMDYPRQTLKGRSAFKSFILGIIFTFGALLIGDYLTGSLMQTAIKKRVSSMLGAEQALQSSNVNEQKPLLPATDLKEARAAISFATKGSTEYACNLLESHLGTSSGVVPDLAYCHALTALFFGNESGRGASQRIASLAGSEEAQSPFTLLAKALLENDSAKQSKLQLELDQAVSSSSIDPLFVAFLASVLESKLGNSEKAENKISVVLANNDQYGPFLLQALKVARNDQRKQEIEAALNTNRQFLLGDFPQFRRFETTSQPVEPVAVATPTPAPKPIEKPVVARVKPKPKPKPRPKKIIKPTPVPTPKLTPLQQLISRGDQYFDKELYSKALVDFQAAQKLAGKEDTQILTRLGYVWFKLYRLDEAYENFNSAVKLDPNQAEAHKGLGMVYDHLGDLEKAAREFSIYLQLKPNASDADEVRANVKALKE